MNQFNSFHDPSLINNFSKEENLKIEESKTKYEKILCNHCGRTSSNGIRCLGICVADNEY